MGLPYGFFKHMGLEAFGQGASDAASNYPVVIDARVNASRYADIIDTLNRRKVDLQKRIKKNQEWCDNFDKQIGGVQDKYDHFLDDMVVLYDNAVKKHAMGIQYLMDHFNYHPLFKHWDDDFTAVPFRPKSKDKA